MARVLIVDDESDARLLLGKSVRMAGHEVVFANNGWEALLVLENDRTPVSLILLDILMPGLDGARFLEILRRGAQSHSIPVIIVTCLDAHDVRSRLDELEVDGIFTKRNHYIERLMEQVTRILDEGREAAGIGGDGSN